MQKTKMIFKKDPEIVAGLGVLGFDELNVYPRMKDVVKMFRKMALRKHPDKPGGSTEDFQILQEAFIRIGSFLQAQQDKSDSITADDEDYEEDIAKKLFKEGCQEISILNHWTSAGTREQCQAGPGASRRPAWSCQLSID